MGFNMLIPSSQFVFTSELLPSQNFRARVRYFDNRPGLASPVFDTTVFKDVPDCCAVRLRLSGASYQYLADHPVVYCGCKGLIAPDGDDLDPSSGDESSLSRSSSELDSTESDDEDGHIPARELQRLWGQEGYLRHQRERDHEAIRADPDAPFSRMVRA
jgi:hypothetical protein